MHEHTHSAYEHTHSAWAYTQCMSIHTVREHSHQHTQHTVMLPHSPHTAHTAPPCAQRCNESVLMTVRWIPTETAPSPPQSFITALTTSVTTHVYLYPRNSEFWIFEFCVFSGFSEDEISNLILQLDVNRDGKISKEEFVANYGEYIYIYYE